MTTVVGESKEMKDNMEELPISEIHASEWDIRRRKEDEAKYEALLTSIKYTGLLNPLTVIRQNGKYILVAGRRRFRALKQLGVKTVPVYIKDTLPDTEKTESRKLTAIENLHRRKLLDNERSYGIAAIYESAGFPLEEAIQGVKSIDNWFSDYTNHKTDWDAYEQFHNSVVEKQQTYIEPQRGPKPHKYRNDKKFVELCKSVGFAPKYQYQILQLVRDLPEKVLEKADAKGLTTDVKIALTNTRLRSEPEMQKILVNRLAKKQDNDTFRELIYQTARDLETGAIRKVGNTYMSYDSRRDKLSTKTEILPSQKGLRITAASKKLIVQLTDIQIARGKIRYDPDVVDKGKDHMIEVVKATGDIQLVSVYENLEVVRKAIEQMQHLIQDEFQARDMKEQMIKE